MSIVELDPQSYLDALQAPELARHLNVITQVRKGLPVDLVDRASQALGLSVSELAKLGVLAPRTVAHSRKSGRLSPTQSDRVTRFLRVFQRTKRTFGTHEKARSWLLRPTHALDGHRPIDLFDTDEGVRLVENLLGRIDYGIAA